jgi:glycogen synthase
LNILYLCDEYPPCKHGGIGTVTQFLARELVKKRHKVTVCGFYPYYRTALPIEDDFGVKVYRRFYGSRLSLYLSRHKSLGKLFNIENEFNSYTHFLIELIKKQEIDLIEIPDFNEAFRYTGSRFISFPDFGISTIVKLHGSYSFVNRTVKGMPFSRSIYEKEKYLVHSASKVLAVSNFSKKEAEEIFGYSKSIAVIHNGISAIQTNRAFNNSNNKYVVYAGTIAEQKGVISLIKAWGMVVEKFPSAKLFLYGKGDIKTLDKINNCITENIKGSVEIKGFIHSSLLPKIFSEASCAIFPSYIESFSMAPLESMQVGCPTIYTKRASGKELISDRVNGLLVDPDDLNEIANAILYILCNPQIAQEMGKKGAHTISEKYCISSVADRHLELYSGLIDISKQTR